MKPIHQKPGDVQRPCFAILYRTYQGESDFRGWLTLEDGCYCRVDLSVVTDWAAQDCLRVFLRPELSKTPIGSYPAKARRYFTILHRTSPKLHDWQSDFKGWILLPGRIYAIGVSVCSHRNGGQYLRLYLRP